MSMSSNSSNDLEIVIKYSPYIYFDENEPFYPVGVGYSIFRSPGQESPSFRRKIEFDAGVVDFAIEYAIYWDYDIQHLYELEHIWTYIDKNGKLVDGEGSFHGRYFKALLKDKSNIEDETHLKVYSQPGKHAFIPDPEIFELVPNLRTATYEEAGKSGLLITKILEGRCKTNEEINMMVKEYLSNFKFRPSMRFKKYVIPDNLFMPWEELYMEIPRRIEDRLEEIRRSRQI